MAANPSLLGGKFRIDREIGRGAMGVVYEATDVRLDRRVAIKVMSAELTAQSDQRHRFEREARVAAALRSEHAVRIHEVGEDARGAPFLVMERLEGRPLDAVITPPPPVATAVNWMLEALQAIGEAHSLGLVHRDIKPGNLFLVERPGQSPMVKVLDFGLAKDLDPSRGMLTTMGAVMGTPAYMAPEQIRAAPVDVRADVWAIGVTLFELLTGGELPFPAPSMSEMIHRILDGEPVPVRALRGDVPPAIEAIIRRCLEKDRALRFANASAIAIALGQTMTALGDTIALPEVQSFGSQETVALGSSDTVALPNRTLVSEEIPAVRRSSRRSHSRSGVTTGAPISSSGVSNTRVFLFSVAAVVVVGIGVLLVLGTRAFERQRFAKTAPVEEAPVRSSEPKPPVVPVSAAPTAPAPPEAQQPDAATSPPANATPAKVQRRVVLQSAVGLNSRKALWLARVQPSLNACAGPIPYRDISIFPDSDGAWVGAHVVSLPSGEPNSRRWSGSNEGLECVLAVVRMLPPPTVCPRPTKYDACEASLAFRFE